MLKINKKVFRDIMGLNVGAIISSSTYPITQFILFKFLNNSEMLDVFRVDATYSVVEAILLSIVTGNFYVKDRAPKGINLPVLLIVILSIPGSILFGIMPTIAIAGNFIILPYTEYVEEHAIFSNNSIIKINIISSIGIISTILIGLNTSVLSNEPAWVKVYILYIIGQLLFDTLPKRIMWRYKVSEIHTFDIFNLSWYKDEMRDILTCLKKDNRDIFRAAIIGVNVYGITYLKGVESIVSIFILTGKLLNPIYSAQSYINKKRRDAIVNSDGESFTDNRSREIAVVMNIDYILLIAVQVCMMFGRMPMYYFILIVLHNSFVYWYWVGTAAYYEMSLFYYGKGIRVSFIYIAKHLIRTLSILTGSLFIHLVVRCVEYIVQWVIVRALYIKIRRSKNLKCYSYGILGINRKEV